MYEKLCFNLDTGVDISEQQNLHFRTLLTISSCAAFNELEEGGDLRLSVLEHQNLSGAALTAVEGDVLVAGVRVKPADALFIVQETRVGCVT